MWFPDYHKAHAAATSLAHYSELAATAKQRETTIHQREFYRLGIENSIEDIAEALGYTVTKKEDVNV